MPRTQRITVSIVEDKAVTREGLEAILRHHSDLVCVGSHANAEEALRAIPEKKPRVVLMDINLPRMSGIECVARLKATLPDTDFLMLTVEDDPDPIFNSLRAGARGYLLKTMSADEIVDAIQQIATGGAPMSAGIARKVVDYFNQLKPPTAEMDTLTSRELEILEWLSKGLHYKEIADQLKVTVFNVRNHLHRIYGKLHVQSRTEAVVKFLKR